jgi:flagellar biosynthesis/type III secretory pathway protein FliH
MEISLDEFEQIKNKAFKAGYNDGYKTGFEEGYVQGVDFSDSCLIDRIDELEEELDELKANKGEAKKNG